ncbi:hypothetical protein ACFW5I_19910 [Streptomyces sp. NPDC058818]|uniref:hypothetical protein n=1 Tax=Streptomyces sp. NPDC058818 TaxID=3346640 RepID=UPI0036CF5E8C
MPDTTTADWPKATQAYATAPDLTSELEWLTATQDRGREWWLRRAALTDRAASDLTPGHTTSAAHAHDLACRLMAIDGSTVGCNPRAYVRQQYALWATNQ